MILVFDSGTTNTKAFLFNEKAELLASASHPTRIIHKSAGMVEQKSEYWWNAIVKSAEKLRSTVNWHKEDITSIAISSQGGTFVPLDGRFNPLRSGITWLDNRAALISKRLENTYGSEYFYNKTGHCLKGWSPPSVCLWLKEKEPSVFSEMQRMSFVADYLNFKLTGRFFLDATSAQMSCFYNIVKGCWDKEILEIAGLKEESLPEVIPSESAGGRVTQEAAAILEVPAGIPVVAGGHDQYCASLGAGAVNGGDCLLSCGTAWALLVITEKPVFIPGANWFPGKHLKEGSFGLMAAISNGGVFLDWMRKNLRLKTNVSEKIGNVKVIPSFTEKRGTVKNLSLATTGDDIYYAAMEALSLTVKQRIGELRGRIDINRLLMVGGGTREKILPGMIEKYTGIQVILPKIIEAAGRGAAILGLAEGLAKQ